MLLWGTLAIHCERFVGTDDTLVMMAEEMLEQRGFLKSGQVVGIVAGTATKTGATNFMRLHRFGGRSIQGEICAGAR